MNTLNEHKIPVGIIEKKRNEEDLNGLSMLSSLKKVGKRLRRWRKRTICLLQRLKYTGWY